MSFTDLPAKFQVKRTDIREMMPNFDEALSYELCRSKCSCNRKRRIAQIFINKIYKVIL